MGPIVAREHLRYSEDFSALHQRKIFGSEEDLRQLAKETFNELFDSAKKATQNSVTEHSREEGGFVILQGFSDVRSIDLYVASTSDRESDIGACCRYTLPIFLTLYLSLVCKCHAAAASLIFH